MMRCIDQIRGTMLNRRAIVLASDDDWTDGCRKQRCGIVRSSGVRTRSHVRNRQLESLVLAVGLQQAEFSVAKSKRKCTSAGAILGG